MKFKILMLLLAVTLTFPGCTIFMMNKMASKCIGNGGVKEIEVADGGYIRVVCKDGTRRHMRYDE